jgi:hypothetical protein
MPLSNAADSERLARAQRNRSRAHAQHIPDFVAAQRSASSPPGAAVAVQRLLKDRSETDGAADLAARVVATPFR